MGTSYQTLLVLADPAPVAAAVAALGVEALVMAVAPGRTAVVPRPDKWGYADVNGLAERLGAAGGWSSLTNAVHDSDIVFLRVYRGPDLAHRYVSDQAMLVEWFEDDDGEWTFRIGDVEYPPGTPEPSGPVGADPALFAPFGAGDVDLDRLGALLRGEDPDPNLRTFAELRHHAILRALNLDPAALIATFGDTALPGAQRVGG